jgi:hypothetical protein
MAEKPVERRQYRGTNSKVAVRVGFEPTEPAKVQRFSRPPDSTTLAPHRISNLPDFRNAGKLAATPTGAVHDTIAGGSQSWPVLGAGFKPAVRYFVSRVGSTPTGFRQLPAPDFVSRIDA